jgi:hypothetical protein
MKTASAMASSRDIRAAEVIRRLRTTLDIPKQCCRHHCCPQSGEGISRTIAAKKLEIGLSSAKIPFRKLCGIRLLVLVMQASVLRPLSYEVMSRLIAARYAQMRSFPQLKASPLHNRA